MSKFNEKSTPARGVKAPRVVAAAASVLLFGALSFASERSPERDEKIKERRQAAARLEAETSLFEKAPALKERARLPTDEVKIGDGRISDGAETGSLEGQNDMKLEREGAKYPR